MNVENSFSDYFGLILLVIGIGGVVWFLWEKIKKSFRDASK